MTRKTRCPREPRKRLIHLGRSFPARWSPIAFARSFTRHPRRWSVSKFQVHRSASRHRENLVCVTHAGPASDRHRLVQRASHRLGVGEPRIIGSLYLRSFAFICGLPVWNPQPPVGTRPELIACVLRSSRICAFENTLCHILTALCHSNRLLKDAPSTAGVLATLRVNRSPLKVIARTCPSRIRFGTSATEGIWVTVSFSSSTS
jgi:hypothetical protein